MESNVLALLLRRIRERKETIEQGLARGRAKNFEDYCRLVGEYAALDTTESEIKDLEKRQLEL